MQKIFHHLKTLFRELNWATIKFFLQHPLQIIPSAIATIDAMVLAEKLYGDGVYGPGNAFRHAYWNAILAHNNRFLYKKQKSVFWAENMTNMHEKLFPNDELPMQVDLQNNAIGRKIYTEMVLSNEKISRKILIKVIQEKTKQAVYTPSLELLNHNKNQLVYEAKPRKTKV